LAEKRLLFYFLLNDSQWPEAQGREVPFHRHLQRRTLYTVYELPISPSNENRLFFAVLIVDYVCRIFIFFPPEVYEYDMRTFIDAGTLLALCKIS